MLYYGNYHRKIFFLLFWDIGIQSYCDMPVVNGGMEAVGEINKIKGENISDSEIDLIIEAVKNVKLLDHEEWKKKHDKEKEKEIEKSKMSYQVVTGKTSGGKMYVRVIGTKDDAEKVAEEYKKTNLLIISFYFSRSV